MLYKFHSCIYQFVQQAIHKMSSHNARMPLAVMVLLNFIVNINSQPQNILPASFSHTKNFINKTLRIPSIPNDELFTLRNLSNVILTEEFNPAVRSIVNHLMGKLDEILKLNELDLDDLDESELEEKLLFLTSSTNGTAILSFSGLIYTLLWAIAVAVVGSMVVCYWVGCEYEEAVEMTTTTTTSSSYGRALHRIAKYGHFNTCFLKNIFIKKSLNESMLINPSP